MNRSYVGAGAALAVLLIAGAYGLAQQTHPPDIPFAPIEDKTLKDPDNPIKRFRVDMARVEHEHPLSRADRMKITQENLAVLSQEHVDQIYGRLTAGPIPDGKYFGDLFFSKGDEVAPGKSAQTRLGEVIGGFEGRLADRGVRFLESFGAEMWKGKVFYRDQRMLKNMIDDSLLLRPLVDKDPPIMTETVPRDGLFSRVASRFHANEVWLLFPAKLYCGQSLLDSRRESVIVDYHFSDEIAGYRKQLDSLADRGGLRIRDEIRMVRPGLYLGRAYANRMFLLNFTLFNPEVAERESASFAAGGAIAEDCWPASEQIRGAAR